MPGAVATAFVDVRGDTSRFNRDVDQGVTSAFSGLGRRLAGIAAAAGVTQAFRTSITEASSLNESMNALDVTFSQFGSDAVSSLEDIGAGAAENLGLTQAQFNEAAVRFSNFAATAVGEGGDVAQGIDDITTRATDFASVMNLDVNEAMALFQSGLAGETEPLRRFGIDLSAAAVEQHALAEGIFDGTGEMTEQQKQMARWSLLMESTNTVAGDFANTQDSLANQMRILGAQALEVAGAFGAGLLPGLEGGLSTLRDFLPQLEGEIGAVGEAVGVALTPAFEAIGPTIQAALAFLPPLLENIGTIFSSLTPLVIPLVNVFGQIATIVGGVLATAFEALEPVINIVAFFIQGFADVLGDTLIPIIEDLAPVLEEIGEIFADVLGEALPVVMELFEAFAPILGEVAGIIGDVLVTVLPILATAFKSIASAIRPLIPVLRDALLRIFEALRPVLPVLAEALVSLAVSLAQILVALTPLIPPLVELAAVLIEEIGAPILLAIAEALAGIAEAFALLAPIVTDLVAGPLTAALTWIADFIADSPVIEEIVGTIASTFENLGTVIGTVVDIISALFSGDWSAAWDNFKQLGSDAINVFLGIWGGIGDRILEALPDLGGLITKGSDLVGAIAQGITDTAATVSDWFTGLVSNAVAWIGSAFGTLVSKGGDLVGAIRDGIVGAASSVSGWFTGLVGSVAGWIGSTFTTLVTKGGDIVGAIAGGVETAITDVIVPFFEGLPSRAVNAIQFLTSGSGRLVEKGSNLVLGVLNGARSFFTNEVIPFFEGLPGRAVDAIQFLTTGSGALLTKGSNLLLGVLNGIEQFWEDTLQPWFEGLPGRIVDAVSGLLEAGGRMAQDLLLGFVRWMQAEAPEQIQDALHLDQIEDSLGGRWGRVGRQNADSYIDELQAVIGAGADRFDSIVDIFEREGVFEGLGGQGSEAGQELIDAINDAIADGSISESELEDLFATAETIAEDHGLVAGGEYTTGLEEGLSSGIDDIDVDGIIDRFGVSTKSAIDSTVAADIEPVFRDLPQGLADAAAKNSGVFKKPGTEFIAGLDEGITARLAGIQKDIQGLGLRMVQWIGDLTPHLAVRGRQLMNGLHLGIVSGLPQITGWLQGFGLRALAAIGSLSETLVSRGVQLVNGLRFGLADRWNFAATWLRGLGLRAIAAVGNLNGALVSRGAQLVNGIRLGLADRWNFAATWLRGTFFRAIAAVGNLNGALVGRGVELMNGLRLGIEGRAWSPFGWLAGVGLRAIAAVGNLNGVLVSRGQQLMDGLRLGIAIGWGRVQDLLRTITSQIPSFKGPEDTDRELLRPAGAAVMEGFQSGLREGWADTQSTLAGFTRGLGMDAAGGGGAAVFGPGAVQVTFSGVTPSDTEAYRVGLQVGRGISDQMERSRIRGLARTA